MENTVTVNGAKTHEESSQTTDKGAQVIAMPQLKLETSNQETVEASLPPLPGNRPIASSNLKISEAVYLPGKRPVNTSDIQIVGTIAAMGERPIAASNIQVWDTIAVSGNRPIASSILKASVTQMIMGSRPIAANNMDRDEDLMGYLD